MKEFQRFAVDYAIAKSVYITTRKSKNTEEVWYESP
jgi:hypothetical protein